MTTDDGREDQADVPFPYRELVCQCGAFAWKFARLGVRVRDGEKFGLDFFAVGPVTCPSCGATAQEPAASELIYLANKAIPETFQAYRPRLTGQNAKYTKKRSVAS